MKKLVSSAIGLQLIADMNVVRDDFQARAEAIQKRHEAEMEELDAEFKALNSKFWNDLSSELDIPSPVPGETDYTLDINHLDLGVAVVEQKEQDQLSCSCPSCMARAAGGEEADLSLGDILGAALQRAH